MDLRLTKNPVAVAGMLIRKSPAEVYEAFVDPAITTRFWFTRSSGRLEVGKRIRWEWEMYGVNSFIDVKALEPRKRILLDWGAKHDKPTRVERTFSMLPDGTTMVSITNSGFSGDGDQVIEQAMGPLQALHLC